ncbi:cell division protein FtsA [Proteiniclasticum sp. C24MP]|uniref:cell division protein FtsA n=1 Tax=Proteiniclasticum sp. C24MP TaxID=3374101 RepID=UPI0037546B12
MQTDNFIIGLDIGTQYIKASASSLQDNTLMYGSVVESQGTDKNGITDIKALSSAIKKVINKLEVKISRNISTAFVCIQPEYVKLIDTQGHASVISDEVTQYEIDKALDGAQLISLEPDEEIVDVIVNKYYVDDTAYKDPLGVKGRHLDIRAQLVTAKKEYVESIYDAMANAKLKVAGTGLGSVAASSLLLSRRDLQNGAILVDTGANMTRATLFKDNRLVDSDVINLGGKSITRDIAIVMKTSLLEAEEVKKGYAKDQLTLDDEKYNLIEEIIKARVEEIMSFVERFCEKYAADEGIKKVVIYGGGLCGFTNINKLYKSTMNKSTNFVTSDIIRDDSVFNIQSGGLAYHLLTAIHCKGAIDEMVRSDNESVDERSKEAMSDEDFFRKYQNQFKTQKETDTEGGYDSDDDYLEEENFFDKIREWFINFKNKIINK